MQSVSCRDVQERQICVTVTFCMNEFNSFLFCDQGWFRVFYLSHWPSYFPGEKPLIPPFLQADCVVKLMSWPRCFLSEPAGTKHKTMLEARTGVGSIKSFPRPGVKSKLATTTKSSTGLQNKTFYCETCDVHVNSETQLKQVRGRKTLTQLLPAHKACLTEVFNK